MCFDSADSDVCDRPGKLSTHKIKSTPAISSVDYGQVTMYRTEYWFERNRDYISDVGHAGFTDAYTRTERPTN